MLQWDRDKHLETVGRDNGTVEQSYSGWRV